MSIYREYMHLLSVYDSSLLPNPSISDARPAKSFVALSLDVSSLSTIDFNYYKINLFICLSICKEGMVESKTQKKSMRKVRVYENNDRFWDLLWTKIDDAKHCVCIATYDMDHKTVAGITLQKMTNAAKRGVFCYLVIDDLNYYPD